METKSETKLAYLRTLQEYVDERLYITDRTDEFKKEFSRNCWYINGSREEIQSLDIDEWKGFLNHLLSDRQKQLEKSSVNTDLVMYLWHDEMAGQLRFNVVTANHPRLPVICKYVDVPIEKILLPFIQDESPGVIPFSELKIVEEKTTISTDSKEEAPDDVVAEMRIVQFKKGSGTPRI